METILQPMRIRGSWMLMGLNFMLNSEDKFLIIFLMKKFIFDLLVQPFHTEMFQFILFAQKRADLTYICPCK